jgi:hypothetical protein
MCKVSALHISFFTTTSLLERISSDKNFSGTLRSPCRGKQEEICQQANILVAEKILTERNS